MANEKHLAILRKGVKKWNAWRQKHDDIHPNLEEAKLAGAELSEANLIGANLFRADLSAANLIAVDLFRADLSRANLSSANLSRANFTAAKLYETDLSAANLSGADLQRAIFDRVDLTRANLTGCRVHGIGAWNLKLEEARQVDLIITDPGQPELTVDNLELAQFVYLLLNDRNVSRAIDTITSKVVLILGRFTPQRKLVLDELREELREHSYIPVLFDFDKPASKDLTGTVQTLANMARFVIADLTDPRCVPHELAFIRDIMVAVQPILLTTQEEYAMFDDLRRRCSWVLEPYRYDTSAALLANLGSRVIAPAEAKAKELRRET
jgi:hypothetical protein